MTIAKHTQGAPSPAAAREAQPLGSLPALAKVGIDHNETRRSERELAPEAQLGSQIRVALEGALTAFNNDPSRKHMLPKDEALFWDSKVLEIVTACVKGAA